jgi:hypothetical protein
MVDPLSFSRNIFLISNSWSKTTSKCSFSSTIDFLFCQTCMPQINVKFIIFISQQSPSRNIFLLWTTWRAKRPACSPSPQHWIFCFVKLYDAFVMIFSIFKSQLCPLCNIVAVGMGSVKIRDNHAVPSNSLAYIGDWETTFFDG